MPRRIESHDLDGPAGKLESLLEEPDDGHPVEAAVVCHPHPLHGGTMHNKVVYRIARGLRRAGCVVLRFNFRGVNRSEGAHTGGRGEVEDARAALAWLRERYAQLPYSLAGFSFGARIALALGCTEAALVRVIAAGYPTRRPNVGALTGCTAPKYFIQSTNDVHGPRAELEEVYAAATEPKHLIWIEAADHFFSGALDRLEDEIAAIGSGRSSSELHRQRHGDPKSI